MPTNVSTILIKATVQKVWDLITKPQYVKLWQYGSDLITDWEIGHDITFSTVWEGTTFHQWGKVLDIKEHEFVSYSLFAPQPGLEDLPENYFIMSYIITALDGQTKLEIIQEDNRTGAVQEEPQGEDNPILKSLKELAEKQ